MSKIEATYSHDEKYPFLLRRKRPDRDIIFIHIPKTGGTSIRHALKLSRTRPDLGIHKHYTAQEIKDFLPLEIWDNAYKFAFIRNPWERSVSHYWFKVRTGTVKKPANPVEDFRAWVQHKLRPKALEGNIKPQFNWLADEAGNLLVDNIFEFKDYTASLDKIFQDNNIKIPKKLPHVNKNKRKEHYSIYYDAASKTKVEEFYRDDIAHFNFTFAPNPPADFSPPKNHSFIRELWERFKYRDRQ